MRAFPSSCLAHTGQLQSAHAAAGMVCGAGTEACRAPISGLARTHHFPGKETDMGDKGKKDKGKREQQKKAMLSPKEKRKLKKEKKTV